MVRIMVPMSRSDWQYLVRKGTIPFKMCYLYIRPVPRQRIWVRALGDKNLLKAFESKKGGIKETIHDFTLTNKRLGCTDWVYPIMVVAAIAGI